MGLIFTVLIGTIFAMAFYLVSLSKDLRSLKLLLMGAESDRDRLAKRNTESARIKEGHISELQKKVNNRDKEIKKYLGALERGVTVDEYVKEEKEAERIREHQEIVRKKLAEEKREKEREAQERGRRNRESSSRRSSYSGGSGYSGGSRSGGSSGFFGYGSDYGGSSSSCSSSSSSSDSGSCGGGSD